MKNNRRLEVLIVLISLGVVFLASLLGILLSGSKQVTTPEEQILKEVYNGQEEGGEEQDKTQQESSQEDSTLPENLLAPFVDMVSWVDTSSEYSINGVPNLQKLHEECGGEYYCLGFVRLSDTNPKQ